MESSTGALYSSSLLPSTLPSPPRRHHELLPQSRPSPTKKVMAGSSSLRTSQSTARWSKSTPNNRWSICLRGRLPREVRNFSFLCITITHYLKDLLTTEDVLHSVASHMQCRRKLQRDLLFIKKTTWLAGGKSLDVKILVWGGSRCSSSCHCSAL